MLLPRCLPGRVRRRRWDRARHAAALRDHEGSRLARAHGVPLWVGEFGALCDGPEAERADRLRSLDDQIATLEGEGAHWSLWTYKDAGVMGLVTLDPDCDYLRLIEPVLAAKRALGTDTWVGWWLPPGVTERRVHDIARTIHRLSGAGDAARTRDLLTTTMLADCAAGLLQPSFARLFLGMSEARIDDILSSFALHRCVPNRALLDVVRRHLESAGPDRAAA